MNEAWIKIFKEYIACYEAIETLGSNSVTDDEVSIKLKDNLLVEIIEAMRSEVEE
jgi:hypothetical protein